VYLTTQDNYALDCSPDIANQSGGWIVIEPHLRSIDPRLAKALSNEVRARALSLVAAGPSSPKAIAAELGLDLRGVAYHVRVLKKLGCIELVETQPRRGAVEHIYRVADWVLEG
jgi:DNA-binding transcriptional ArsR family regulator